MVRIYIVDAFTKEPFEGNVLVSSIGQMSFLKMLLRESLPR